MAIGDQYSESLSPYVRKSKHRYLAWGAILPAIFKIFKKKGDYVEYNIPICTFVDYTHSQ